ncbi:MAG: 50S ribosomal protein L18 [Gammaproteobacteria bacterium CG11_big_fil_rev_8_21_14_0_20_46_22]|nr:MAG: 50S ribosomal protein L18 [Gammaproteobacteria bacterium CG12_big_fil_rev_8_21_14_0_65_46_12]PIR11323.1 MAG: 50S ribosomal protein L18 [Gammaproteobacteria bacterium CG11_big_fil_rev_8_21_14_0_20_46_22]
MISKKIARLRRAKKSRGKIARLDASPRLSVYRSNQHVYAQVLTADGSKVLAQASSLDKAVSTDGDGKATATAVGRTVAERAKAAGVSKVAFDRSGYRYHGRVKALADGAREAGLDF